MCTVRGKRIGQGRTRDPDIERDSVAEALGLALARARAAAGMTQHQAERRSGVSHTTIVRAESGRGLPSVRSLLILVMTYDTTIEAIAGDACL